MTAPSLAYQDAMNGIAILYYDWEFGEDITHWMPLPELPKD